MTPEFEHGYCFRLGFNSRKQTRASQNQWICVTHKPRNKAVFYIGKCKLKGCEGYKLILYKVFIITLKILEEIKHAENEDNKQLITYILSAANQWKENVSTTKSIHNDIYKHI